MKETSPSDSKLKKTTYIGKRIKQLREELGLTQEQMKSLLGAENQTTISNLENKGMTGEFLWDYLAYLHKQGYNPSWIVLKDNSSIAKTLNQGQGIRYYKAQMKDLLIMNSKMMDLIVAQKNTLDDLERISPPAAENTND